MAKKTAQRSSLFLLELIIAILFFILAATACVKCFVHSHQVEKDSIAQNQAVLISASIAEVFRSQEDPQDILQQLYPVGCYSEDTFYIYYDNNWEMCSASDACYTVSFTTEYRQPFKEGYICVSDSDSVIYDLTIDKYMNQEVVSP